MHKVFKPFKKGDELRSATIYGDGHVVVWFARWIRDTNTRIDYVKVAESIGVRASFEGYICFKNASMLIAISSLPNARIRAHAANVESGSDNTRKLGLVVGGFTVDSAYGYFIVNALPELLSGSFTVQTNATPWTFEQSTQSERWGHSETAVVEVYRDDKAKAA